VLTAANFSVGVNVLLSLVATAAAALGPEYEVEIVEAHHRRKEDAPSGTALALGRAVAGARGVELDAVRRDGRSGRPGARPAGEIGFHALRGGSIVGEHQVWLIGEMDRLELVHRAADRALFAEGALRAAAWLAGRAPGRYSMRDVLGL
jgi:4-hydroxy-tetrahydrodipicolinate reductase